MTTWILFVGASLLAWVLWGRSKPSFLWVVAALLTVVAAQSFAELGLGQFAARTLIGGPLSWFGGAQAAATVLALITLAYAIFDVAVDKKLDKGGAFALFVLPLLCIVAGPGSLVSGINGFYDAVQNGGVTVLASLGA